MILDASAILALLYEEPGQALVIEALHKGAAACSVNLAEAATVLIRDGMAADQAETTILELPLAIRDADWSLALTAAKFYPETKEFGLSLGDRLCLALAARENRPVLTTDRIWMDVGPRLGVSVRAIR
jgi:PIN domain nuclease of toxin-antitoxin system